MTPQKKSRFYEAGFYQFEMFLLNRHDLFFFDLEMFVAF